MKILKNPTFNEFIEVNEYVAKTSPMSTHYHSPNPAERLLWRTKKKKIYQLLDSLPIKTLLDLGCGDGGMFDTIPEKISYLGVDISPTQIKNANDVIKKTKRKNAKVKQGDILKLDIKNASYDAVLLCDIVEHVLQPDVLFKEIKRIVKKDGYIIMSIPNETLWLLMRAALLRFPLHSPDHVHSFMPADIKNQFKKVEKQINIPVPISSHLSLIHIYVIKNV